MRFIRCTAGLLSLQARGARAKTPIRALKISVYFDSIGIHACSVYQQFLPRETQNQRIILCQTAEYTFTLHPFPLPAGLKPHHQHDHLKALPAFNMVPQVRDGARSPTTRSLIIVCRYYSDSKLEICFFRIITLRLFCFNSLSKLSI